MFFLRENPKKKKRGKPLRNSIILAVPSFHRKWRGELIYLLDPSGLTGLEPVTSALTGRCSSLLNYNPREIRRDLAENLDSFFSLVLYQVFLKNKRVIPSDSRLANCWAELDLNQRRHIANEFTVRPH